MNYSHLGCCCLQLQLPSFPFPELAFLPCDVKVSLRNKLAKPNNWPIHIIIILRIRVSFVNPLIFSSERLVIAQCITRNSYDALLGMARLSIASLCPEELLLVEESETLRRLQFHVNFYCTVPNILKLERTWLVPFFVS